MVGEFFIGLLLMGLVHAQNWNVTLDTNPITIHDYEVKEVEFSLSLPTNPGKWKVVAENYNEKLINVEVPNFENISVIPLDKKFMLKITGIFLGRTEIVLKITQDEKKIIESNALPVTIIRPHRFIDTAFIVCVATLVSILYVNFGCAMDWKVTRETIKRPIGPLIGSLCQFIIMPALAFGIGHFLFPDNPELQIAVFFTGISPSGEASNIWTVLLGGNLNLSITMTTLSTLAAFATVPFWVFTLGKLIFDKGNLAVPYRNMATIAICAIIPLAIGFIIQKKFPRLCRIMVRIMKPCSIILILFIIIFAVVTNLYLFELFSWQIILAGLGLPWLGYISGLITMLIFRQPRADVTAISIETGVKNTGISIFLLRFSMAQPDADLTTVIPVACAVMTPIPPMIAWIVRTISNRRKKKINASTEKLQDDTLPATTTNFSSITH